MNLNNIENEKRCIIIAGSPLFSKIDIRDTDFIIACDRGYNHAINNNIFPHLVVGDFDSLDGNINKDIPILKVKAEKDDTDTMLGVKYALEHGMNNIVLLGATGGRIDHQLANFSTAGYIANQGGMCTIIDNDNILYAFKDSIITLKRKEHFSLSVFSYTDKCYGVTLNGLKYKLNNATIENTFPIGVSNEFIKETATIKVESGILFVVLSRLES